MKKILLATTLLAASSTVALADAHMTWGASAAAGIASNGFDDNGTPLDLTDDVGAANPNGDADNAFATYSTVSLDLTLSGSTDGGLTFGATFDLTAGTSYDLADDDGFDDEGATFGMPTIFVSGSFGKLEISDDNFDFYDDANGGGDARYTGTFGAVTVGLIADVDANEASLSLGYTAGNLALSANTDTYDEQNISATYTMGVIAITASSALNETDDSSLKVAYSSNGISASAQFNTSDESIDIAAGYAANGLSLNASTNSESNNWEVTAGYDLGGGLALTAGTNYTQDIMVGATMAF
jgi:outer membrane protein OmpU